MCNVKCFSELVAAVEAGVPCHNKIVEGMRTKVLGNNWWRAPLECRRLLPFSAANTRICDPRTRPSQRNAVGYAAPNTSTSGGNADFTSVATAARSRSAKLRLLAGVNLC
jgi:hypothetical protein